MADAFVGLDLGTTGIKAVAFDEADRELALAARPTPTHHLADGGAEYEANELWAVACIVLQEVVETLKTAGHRVVAIATASMGEAGVLLDGAGRPSAPVIAWFDPRTEPETEWWIENVGADRTKRIAALPPRPVFGALKMLWTKNHDPAAWAAGHRWLNMADWAAYRLSGAMATDYSLASRTMLLDVTERRWSGELIAAAGIDPTVLCPLVQSGHPVGSVSDAASIETGLPVGATVGAGGQDHVCAALALGVTKPGMLLDSIGTAEAFFLVMDTVDASGRVADAGIGQGAHVQPGRTYAMTGLQHGGGRIDAARIQARLDWEPFLAAAEAASVIDAVAIDGAERIDLLLDVTGATSVQHIVTGGGSRNEQLIERKREIGGRPIDVASMTEATALGAARLAKHAAAIAAKENGST